MAIHHQTSHPISCPPALELANGGAAAEFARISAVWMGRVESCVFVCDTQKFCSFKPRCRSSASEKPSQNDHILPSKRAPPFGGGGQKFCFVWKIQACSTCFTLDSCKVCGNLHVVFGLNEPEEGGTTKLWALQNSPPANPTVPRSRALQTSSKSLGTALRTRNYPATPPSFWWVFFFRDRMTPLHSSPAGQLVELTRATKYHF